MSDETLWKVVAAIASGGATFVGACIAYAGVKTANALKNREIVKGALDLLTGGTQKRTVGIALISELVDTRVIRSKTVRMILEGQAAHLEDPENTEAKRPIEIVNLANIKKLLSELR